MDVLYPAHIRSDSIQTCNEHGLKTAEYAKGDLQSVRLGTAAYLAGLLHDMGKYSEEFRQYLESASKGGSVHKGSVIHSFAGAYYLLSHFHKKETAGPFMNMTAELLAYAVGAHHGLFDCVDDNKHNQFVKRLTKQPEYEQKAIKNFLAECCSEEKLDEVFKIAESEITAVSGSLLNLLSDTEDGHKAEEYLFYIGLLARLLSSAVMDGDRRDTAEFMAGTDFSCCVSADKNVWRTCREHLEARLDEFPVDTEIQKARREISDLCYAFAREPSGVYRLNVPTGGGKTLSSLRYALAHAEEYGKKRIIYTAPLISILDQNARVIREAVGNDQLILEHHSNIVRTEDKEDLSNYDLLAETWDAPIIVTTLVQFLNTCFLGKTTSVRRFQALCDSIVILDEVQTVPTNMLSLFNLAVNFLSGVMGATVILCSATQPCLEKLEHKLIVNEKPMIPKDRYETFATIFKRTKLIDKGSIKLADIPDMARQILGEADSLLIICNTKKEAAEVFRSLYPDYKNCYHLSASICMAHRKQVLYEIYDSLKNRKKTICVSTQVIEAGVDISFGSVIRLTAGIDNIVQAAGRCNRNGEKEGLAPVYIVRAADEQLGKLPEILYTQNALHELMQQFASTPDVFQFDLASDTGTEVYYDTLYKMFRKEAGGHFDYPVKGTSLFKFLSDNPKFTESCKEAGDYTMRHAFKTAGSLFKVFEDDTESVIVPFEKGCDIIAALSTERAKHDMTYVKCLLDQGKEYSVSVYSWQMDKLLKSGSVRPICDGRVYALLEDNYGKYTGLQVEPVEKEESEWSTQIL